MDQCALLSFDQHLAVKGKTEKHIAENDVTSWIQPMYDTLSRNTIASKVRILRVFLKNMRHKGILVYIPPSPKVPEAYVPYLFSDMELQKIFTTADAIPFRKGSNRHLELPMLLRMLYSCGFRLGELLETRIEDIDFDLGIILLRDTKNRKQRIVPLGDTLTDMLKRYCLAMNLIGKPDSCLFPGPDYRKHISQRSTESWFEDLLKETGIYTRTKKYARGQCLHCFRHLFVIKSFSRAEKTGRPVNDSIPFLSIYLGHNSINETEKYLKFSSDMFPEHTVLFETYSEGIFPEVCYED
jgi:integrase